MKEPEIKKITLVTGNPNKLKEIKAIAAGRLDISSMAIDLPEIQSLDLQEIIDNKVKAAFAAVKAPVIVEDVSAGLDGLEGLPGPFYKFFRAKLGDRILVKLAESAKNDRITIKCMAAYYDGHKIIYGLGTIRGRVVEPRGNNGFGFDPLVIPDGYKRTMAEMSIEQKQTISHRGLAFKELFTKLESLL